MPELTQEQVKARAGASRPQPGSSRALCPWVLAGRTSQRHSQLPVQGRLCYRQILPLSLAWQTGVQFLLCPAPSLVLRTMAPDTLTPTSSEPTGTSHLACQPALSSIRHTDRSLGFWIFKSDFQSPLKTLQRLPTAPVTATTPAAAPGLLTVRPTPGAQQRGRRSAGGCRLEWVGPRASAC